MPSSSRRIRHLRNLRRSLVHFVLVNQQPNDAAKQNDQRSHCVGEIRSRQKTPVPRNSSSRPCRCRSRGKSGRRRFLRSSSNKTGKRFSTRVTVRQMGEIHLPGPVGQCTFRERGLPICVQWTG